MARGTRERMVASAVDLLARRGLQATSFSEVLDHSGAPRGSVYHHFPGGKDQMIGSALDAASSRAIELLDLKAGAPAEEIATWFLHIWREVLIRGKFEAGCAVLAVAIAADSRELLDHTPWSFVRGDGGSPSSSSRAVSEADDAQRFAAIARRLERGRSRAGPRRAEPRAVRPGRRSADRSGSGAQQPRTGRLDGNRHT